MMGPAAVELQKSLDVFGEEGMAESSLPDSVQSIFRESREKSWSMMMSSSTSKIRKCTRPTL